MLRALQKSMTDGRRHHSRIKFDRTKLHSSYIYCTTQSLTHAINCARNHLKGGLEPLRGLRALREIELYCNQLNGDLEPLRGLHGLHGLYLRNNEFRGSIEPLQGCTALLFLNVSHNQLNGDLAPLEGCKVLATG